MHREDWPGCEGLPGQSSSIWLSVVARQGSAAIFSIIEQQLVLQELRNSGPDDVFFLLVLGNFEGQNGQIALSDLSAKLASE